MEKDVKILVDGYDKFTRIEVTVQKTPGNPGTNLSKIELKYPTEIEKYGSFAGKIMWYTTKVGPDVANS